VTEHFAFIPILSEPECLELLAEIDGQRAIWTRRHPQTPFFTLGAASYLDAKPVPRTYFARAEATNQLLVHRFANLYARVRAALVSHLDAAILDLPSAGLPGFHIFGSHPAFRDPTGSVHFDLQYELVPWPEPLFRDQVLSFTLPLTMPTGGGGLRYWDLTPDSLAKLRPVEQKALIGESPMHYLPYTIGTLVLHSGHLLHQIAPAPELTVKDRRVTLQGHIGRTSEGYYWYW
jgi:hypothetical protein